MNNMMNTLPMMRWRLLSTVSALALLASGYSGGKAMAAGDDADRPQIWIEFGGQAENIAGQGETFAPAFLAANPNSSVLWKGTSPLEAQQPPPLSFGEEAKISFEPDNSDWVVSAAVRYGRAKSVVDIHHQTYSTFHHKYESGVPVTYNSNPAGINKFADTQVHRSENHSVIDFVAGKDLGLGMFGPDGSSIVSVGARFAQFTSRMSVDMRARPEVDFKYVPSAAASNRFKEPYFHTYHASGHASRRFQGVGPQISWAASTSLVTEDGNGINLDWGVNGALLFGKQKSVVGHHASGHYVPWGWGLGTVNGYYHSAYTPRNGGHNSSKSVMVPNLGGFAGMSFRYSGAKISFGYRADFFFGAIDGGINARKSETLGFKGPFASISFGLGD